MNQFVNEELVLVLFQLFHQNDFFFAFDVDGNVFLFQAVMFVFQALVVQNQVEYKGSDAQQEHNSNEQQTVVLFGRLYLLIGLFAFQLVQGFG